MKQYFPKVILRKTGNGSLGNGYENEVLLTVAGAYDITVTNVTVE